MTRPRRPSIVAAATRRYQDLRASGATFEAALAAGVTLIFNDRNLSPPQEILMSIAAAARAKHKPPAVPKPGGRAREIPPDAMQILRKCKPGPGDPPRIILPDYKGPGAVDGRMPRALYERVDDALRRAGATWKKNVGHVVHPATGKTPASILAELLGTGVAHDWQQRDGYYSTPDAVVRDLLRVADVLPGHIVLEPSAGTGAICRELRERYGQQVVTVAVEMNRARAEIAADLVDACVCADFLAWRHEWRGVFDRVVANPPFANGAAVAHVDAMLDCLAPAGRLACVVPSVFVTAGLGRTAAERDLLTRINRDFSPIGVIPLHPDAFRSAGTGAATKIITVDRFGPGPRADDIARR